MRTPSCQICGERLFGAVKTPDGEMLCGPCRFERPPFARAAAFGGYEGGLRELIQLLKYDHVRPAAEKLGELLASAILDVSASFGDHAPLAIPVPLHKSKLRQRGFNQSESIARVALQKFRTADLRSLELRTDLLLRTRPTISQTGLTRPQRLENVRGAFSVGRRDLLDGRDILLLDDVFTTGTTVSECARVLRRAGAERIFVATVARVFAPEPERIVLPQKQAMAAHA